MSRRGHGLASKIEYSPCWIRDIKRLEHTEYRGGVDGEFHRYVASRLKPRLRRTLPAHGSGSLRDPQTQRRAGGGQVPGRPANRNSGRLVGKRKPNVVQL